MASSSFRRLLTVAVLAALALTLTASTRRQPGPTMPEAAARFVESLTPAQRESTVFSYDSPKRLDWHYVPRNRPGLLLKDMNDEQRRLAHDLLRTALSSAGYLKAASIMELDAVLHDLEVAAGGLGASRDPLLYSFAVFGDPAHPEHPWGWKVEGHHLSLNFSSSTAQLTATSPAFFGAHPARVEAGPSAGLRVLAAEEDLARELVQLLPRKAAGEIFFRPTAPGDILFSPGRGLPPIAEAVGMPLSHMTPENAARLRRLVEEYARNLKPGLADAQFARIAAAGWDNVRFAWAGEVSAGRPHYYRITGPTFIIEYDNTQNDANHIHTVWHDLEHNFGASAPDPLREHLQRDHAAPPPADGPTQPRN